MRIAFLHYHLKTGGVTTVIRQQVHSLAGRCETLVLSGAPAEDMFPTDVVHIPSLAYEQEQRNSVSAPEVADALLSALFERWPRGPDVLHVHNPTLAKNFTLLPALSLLRKKGIRLLLQIHDFAEDGRPSAYSSAPYPDDCHYAVLNSRDFEILRRCGLKPEGLHLVPNTVLPFPEPEAPVAGENLVLYPVRAIRRKNIGEALLVSLFFREGETLAVTRPPNSPADHASHVDWKRFSREKEIRVLFDAGLNRDFIQMVHACRAMLTTSITEGFGFSFLEPWTAGKPLCGRKLPDICRDYENRGIFLNHLYPQLPVPTLWFGEDRVKHRWIECYKESCNRFGLIVSEGTLQDAWARAAPEGWIDFGLLDEGVQKEAIDIVRNDPTQRNSFLRANPFMGKGIAGSLPSDRELKTNRRLVLQHFSLSLTRNLLLETYCNVCDIDVRHRIDKTTLLESFLAPETFSLLKWSPYVPC